jgi:putative ABC transport system permease protein
MAVFRRMLNVFRRDRLQHEIDAELQGHIDLRTEENIASGMTPEEARREARLRFGNPTVTRERVAAADAALGLGIFGRNLRYGLRQLRRSPGFTVAAVLVLALGIGPNVAIFSIIWATFLAPPPYPNANQLVVVWNHFKAERIPSAGEDYAEYAAQSHSFQSLSFQSWITLHLTNSDHTADQEGGLGVTPGLQTKTAIQPMLLGRDFLPDEGGPGTDHVVMLSNWLWQHRYNSDPNIIGKSILIEDQPYTVIGVMRASPHERGGSVEFTVPVRLIPGERSPQFGIIIGRLKPGVTLAQAQAEVSVIAKRIETQHSGGRDTGAFTLTVEHFRNDWLDLKTQRNLWLLLAAVGLVLLIACANIANLLLARGTARQQELAVRSALGATRSQIFMQLLTESLTLALLGGAVGIAMGWGIMKLSMVILPDLAIQSSDTLVEMNLPVLCISIVIALFAGVLAGCIPSWRAARLNVSEMLKQGSRSAGGRGRTSLQSVLVAAEIALALILLAGAGMALHSFWNLSHIDVGFTADHVLTAMLRPRDNSVRGGRPNFPPPEQVVVQQHQLLNRVRTIPGVADAALATQMPLHGFDTFPFAVAGETTDRNHLPTADFEAVTPSFFRTFGIRLVRGRLLADSDAPGAPPAIMVNETFVRRYLPNDDPMTHQVVLRLPIFSAANSGKPTMPPPVAYQIVGVFHDVLDNEHLTGAVQPEMYASQWQIGWPFASIAVRTLGMDPAMLTQPLQRAISSVQAGTAIDHVEVMDQVLGSQTSSDRFEMVLFGGFAFVALLLAAVGIYGVMSFAVAQRTHEIGVRMALGAQRREVISLVVRSGMRMALIGIVIGLAGALGLGLLMRKTLYGVTSADPGSLIAVALLLFAVALFACWIPARRSAAVDPMQALRTE